MNQSVWLFCNIHTWNIWNCVHTVIIMVWSKYLVDATPSIIKKKLQCLALWTKIIYKKLVTNAAFHFIQFLLFINHRQRQLDLFTCHSQSPQHSSSCSAHEHDYPMCMWGTSKPSLWQKQNRNYCLLKTNTSARFYK